MLLSLERKYGNWPTVSSVNNEVTPLDYVAGVDEVGRGCIYGPVVVAAVVFPPGAIESELPPCRDSKKLTSKKREELYDKIYATAAGVSVATGSAADIDERNILNVTLECFSSAIKELSPACYPSVALIDGNQTPSQTRHGWPADVSPVTVVKGDDTSLSIAAASIIAKVTRDRMMKASVELDPSLETLYGIGKNKGYPTPAHKAAVKHHGYTAEHRRTFILK